MDYTDKYFLSGILLFSFIVSIPQFKSLKEESNFLAKLIAFLSLITIGFLIYFSTIGVTVGIFSIVKNYYNGDVYEATIVSYRSYTKQESDSRMKRRYEVTYNVPMFEFFVNNKKIKVESSAHTSSSVPIIGSTLKISYSKGGLRTQEHKFSDYLVFFMFFVISTFWWFTSLIYTAYSLGYPLKNKKTIFFIMLKTHFVLLQLFLMFCLYFIYIKLIVVSIWGVLSIITFIILSLFLAIRRFQKN
nr:hypothetical protein [uncultured Flavobacterium sp.]